MKPLNELTDAELSECFAVEVAGWEPETAWEGRFATSADAVLPWLGKQPWSADGEPEVVKISIFDDFGNALSEGTSRTFARAACIALIEAKRRDWK